MDLDFKQNIRGACFRIDAHYAALEPLSPTMRGFGDRQEFLTMSIETLASHMLHSSNAKCNTTAVDKVLSDVHFRDSCFNPVRKCLSIFLLK